MMHNLPAHTNCNNCGACCGMIPVTNDEMQEILKYVSRNPPALSVAAKHNMDLSHCPFRDDEKKKCAIYPVRPLACKMFGVCAGMQCMNGNSANIDGTRFVGPDYDLENILILNAYDFNA